MTMQDIELRKTASGYEGYIDLGEHSCAESRYSWHKIFSCSEKEAKLMVTQRLAQYAAGHSPHAKRNECIEKAIAFAREAGLSDLIQDLGKMKK